MVEKFKFRFCERNLNLQLEKEKNSILFFSHTAGSMGLGVLGVFRSDVLSSSVVLLPYAIAWPAPPTHPLYCCFRIKVAL